MTVPDAITDKCYDWLSAMQYEASLFGLYRFKLLLALSIHPGLVDKFLPLVFVRKYLLNVVCLWQSAMVHRSHSRSIGSCRCNYSQSPSSTLKLCKACWTLLSKNKSLANCSHDWMLSGSIILHRFDVLRPGANALLSRYVLCSHLLSCYMPGTIYVRQSGYSELERRSSFLLIQLSNGTSIPLRSL